MSILLSALFAGLVAVGVTVAIERWGGIVGGVLGTLPSTIVPASIGIHAASADGEAFAAAMASAPASMFLNVLFLYLWRVLPPHLPGQTLGRKLALMSGLGLGLWTCGAVATVVVVEDWRSGGGDPRLMGLVLTGMIGLVGLAATWQSHPAPAGRRSVGAAVLVLRGLLAAVAIAVSNLAFLGIP